MGYYEGNKTYYDRVAYALLVSCYDALVIEWGKAMDADEAKMLQTLAIANLRRELDKFRIHRKDPKVRDRMKNAWDMLQTATMLVDKRREN